MTTSQNIQRKPCVNNLTRSREQILKIAKLVETHGRAAASERFGLPNSTITAVVVKANRLKKAAAQ